MEESRRVRVPRLALAALGASLTLSLLVVVPVAASSSRDSTTTSAPSTTLVGTTTGPPTSTTTPVTTTTQAPRSLSWPAGESAAVIDSTLSVAAASPRQSPVAIASLTKMMTIWVILHRLPLAPGQLGPCHVVSAHDLAVYRHDLATDQSNAAVALGVRLCENVLLHGVLVHSAGNYAEILVEMTGLRDAQFVAVMNATARSMGMRQTHYVDVTGIGAGDRSTAQDQVRLAATLMASEPIVAAIVKLPSVRLPVAGVVASYTPFVGQGGVVGVKSGYTDLAGGCDVLAVDFTIGSLSTRVYAAVLGDHGPNAIVGAAQAALSLARELRLGIRLSRVASGLVLTWTGPAQYVVTTTTTTTTTTTSTTTTTTAPTGTTTTTSLGSTTTTLSAG